ncbi:ankyrin repeat-containing protein [Trifolium medium]|uniref:Ankyrin repeat-containing protein n=1 Tax=Trifolium medium TaxID=97028 RepID=A0A392M1T4_9FABA|nr:ankyrin repeat-containing protein [Trifolium medium]
MLDQTALHVAAIGAQWKLVEKLVQLMPANMVIELDSKGFTCLHYVAFGKSVDAAKALVTKNSSVTQVPDFIGFTPLYHCITSTRCKEMAWYLVFNTIINDRSACPFSDDELSCLLGAGFHDIAMYILKRYPTAFSDSSFLMLFTLSELPSHFQSGHNFGFWKRCIYHCVPRELEYGNTIWNVLQTLVPSIKLARDAKLRHVSAVRVVEFVCSQVSANNDSQFWQSPNVGIIFNAISSGIVEIVSICFRLFPDLVWTHNPNEGYAAQVAIRNRQEKVFSLLCKMPSICKMQVMHIFTSGPYTSTSHLAARFASQVKSIPGAAFQMQRELQWFKVCFI